MPNMELIGEPGDQRMRISDDDFEEIPLEASKSLVAASLVEIPHAERSQIQEPPAEQTQLSFDEIFKLLVSGEEIKLRFKSQAEYNSLRASLLRRYRGYQEIQMVLGTDKEEFLQCSCKGIIKDGGKNVSSYDCRFKVQPAALKSNGSTRKYEILRDL